MVAIAAHDEIGYATRLAQKAMGARSSDFVARRIYPGASLRTATVTADPPIAASAPMTAADGWATASGTITLSRIYATSGRVISGDRRCNTRSGLVRGMVLHVATAVPASASTASRTWCGVVMM